MPDELTMIRNTLGDLRVLAAQLSERQSTALEERKRLWKIVRALEAWVEERKITLANQSGVSSGVSYSRGQVFKIVGIIGTIIGMGCSGLWALIQMLLNG